MFVASYIMHACKIKGGREEGGGERKRERGGGGKQDRWRESGESLINYMALCNHITKCNVFTINRANTLASDA